MEEKKFNMNYGLIVVDPLQEGEMMDIIHFCGYEVPPTKNDAAILREELMTDPEFGLTEIAEHLDILPAPDDIVKKYRDDYENSIIKSN